MSRPKDITDKQLLILLATMSILILFMIWLTGCSSVPTEHGRAYLVGDVAYATADPSGMCSIDDVNRDSDFGKEEGDLGKHKTRHRAIQGGAVCYEGSGITDNLRAAIAFVVGLLL